MRVFALDSPRKLLATACTAVLLLFACAARAQDDPPAEAGRISSISGTVSIQPYGTQDWGQAYPNLTIGPGDRIYTDSDGRAEIQVGQSYLRVGPNTDVSLVDDTPFGITFGIAQGSVHLRSNELWPRQLMNVSTPNGNAGFDNAGELRVDVYPTDGATVFTNLGNFADITAAGDFRQELGGGQSLQLSGSNPVYPQWLQPAPPDNLDYWSRQRDEQLARVASYQYVSPEVPGAADLDAYGNWQPETDYGAIWYPSNVPPGWAPYQYGHWINREPWGWVWVEDEPWGYAPFHYGRWVYYRERWGWVPGPVAVRPVWSPALVVFAGGISGGVSAWFPLGPGEPYRPWYRCSPRYIDQVNITNIREAPRVQVQRTYVNIVNVTNVTNITYVNQSRGLVAVRHEDFASGRDVHNTIVRVDSNQIQHVQPLTRPDVAPPQQPFITRPAAHPVRVSAQRPVLINQQGNMVAAQPGAAPVKPPVRPAPPARPVPGRTVIATPVRSVQPASPVERPATPLPGRQEGNPNQPATPYQGGRPAPTPQRPVEPQNRPVQPVEPQSRPVPPNANQQERIPNTPQERPQPQQRPEPVPPPPPQEARPTPPQASRPEYAPPPQNRQEKQPQPPPKNEEKNNKEKKEKEEPHS